MRDGFCLRTRGRAATPDALEDIATHARPGVSALVLDSCGVSLAESVGRTEWFATGAEAVAG